LRKPNWLVKPLPDARALKRMRGLLSDLDLHTICESANCPNLGECWAKATATFLILGDVCTRHCGFCDVPAGRPAPLDAREPTRVAEAVRALGLAHVVITSVTRDDVPDGGAAHFAATITAIGKACPKTSVEVLIPDFSGDSECLATVLAAEPRILGHNIETVRSLHNRIRPRFDYEQSLGILAEAKRLAPFIYTKSSIMVGLGETQDDVIATLNDLRQVDCDFVTIGQYLQPSRKNVAVREYVAPATFDHYRHIAKELGFRYVASGPFVRSSYNAAAALETDGYSDQLAGGQNVEN
jgi:lipoic acid synthetase